MEKKVWVVTLMEVTDCNWDLESEVFLQKEDAEKRFQKIVEKIWKQVHKNYGDCVFTSLDGDCPVGWCAVESSPTCFSAYEMYTQMLFERTVFIKQEEIR